MQNKNLILFIVLAALIMGGWLWLQYILPPPTPEKKKDGDIAKADDKTVAKSRRKLEATAEIPQLSTTTGADKKSRPARKAPKPKRPVAAAPADTPPT